MIKTLSSPQITKKICPPHLSGIARLPTRGPIVENDDGPGLNLSKTSPKENNVSANHSKIVPETLNFARASLEKQKSESEDQSPFSKIVEPSPRKSARGEDPSIFWDELESVDPTQDGEEDEEETPRIVRK